MNTMETIIPEIVTAPEKKQRKPFRKPVGALAKPSKDAADISVKYDIPIKEAYQIVTGKPPHKDTVEKIEKHIERWSLRHPAALKSAAKSIRSFAAGKEVNGIKPKDSTVLAAATRIVDQVDPVTKQTVNLNIDATTEHPFDLDIFRRR